MPRPVSLSMDLLRTFLLMVQTSGDASQAAKQLRINQPSMSKRLGYLQHVGPVLDRPWLVREGKSWHLTEEGRRVLPAVQEIVRRYEQLTEYLGPAHLAVPQVHFACGQQTVMGFVQQAIKRFQSEQPKVRLRITTLRGRQRIERVANGSLDLATVTHSEVAIRKIARRPLYTEAVDSRCLTLVCSEDSPWSGRVKKLPKTKVTPENLVDFPLILPEPDAGIRRTLDHILLKNGLLGSVDIRMEIGGWTSILAYVREGLGVGVVSEAALNEQDGLVVRYFDTGRFPLIVTRLICRRVLGTGEDLDLSDEAQAFRKILLEVGATKWLKKER
ncbi:MAG: LysR family transcriptional regulator [Gemmataceae bacterium]